MRESPQLSTPGQWVILSSTLEEPGELGFTARVILVTARIILAFMFPFLRWENSFLSLGNGFQPQKPQGSMLGFGDALLFTLASGVSPFSLTSVYCIWLPPKYLSFPLFLTPSHLSGSQKLAAVPAAAVGRGRQAPGQLLAAALLPVLILQPLRSAPSVAALGQGGMLGGEQGAVCWSR